MSYIDINRTLTRVVLKQIGLMDALQGMIDRTLTRVVLKLTVKIIGRK